jgi:hypothetical protein
MVNPEQLLPPPASTDAKPAVIDAGGTPIAGSPSALAPTNIYAHNFMLRKGPTGFRVYVRWLRGQMSRTSRNTNPSLNDPESFYIDVKNAVIQPTSETSRMEGYVSSPVSRWFARNDSIPRTLTST